MFVGSWISGAVVEHYASPAVGDTVMHDWRSIWLFPAMMSGVILLLFLLTFSERKKDLVSDVELAPQTMS